MTRRLDRLAPIFRWVILPLLFVVGVPLAIAEWGSNAVYAEYLMGISVLGFLCAMFVVLTWTPYIVRARLRGKLNVSALAVIDFATLAYLGSFVFGMRIVLVFVLPLSQQHPPGTALMVLNLSIWTLVLIKVLLRAYIWWRAMRRGPGALDAVSRHSQSPLRVVDVDE